MTVATLSKKDLQQLSARGLTAEEVQRQIALLSGPSPSLVLDRPCTVGDGIRTLTARDQEECAETFNILSQTLRVCKFVPASGAATRMFEDLLAAQAGSTDNGTAQSVAAFLEHLPRFPFYEDLTAALARDGQDIEALRRGGSARPVLDYFLTSRGLDYAARPKGLLKFHRYPNSSRTALEEHLVEATHYARDAEGVCRLHLTVSEEHRDRWGALCDRACEAYGREFGVRFDVQFSFQHARTATVAVNMNNQPFRDAAGHLLFRPGGHGALIENLGAIDANIVFVKNIDNIAPDRLKAPAMRWKKVLGGLLLRTQQRIQHFRTLLETAPHDDAVVAEASEFLRRELCVGLPAELSHAQPAEVRRHLAVMLDRPLRVCGMVRNQGEPGGGPFWVRGCDGSRSLQIVESAQVDARNSAQQMIWGGSTHFNPVDLVCAMRDLRGRPFDLRRYIDASAVFVSHKSSDGRPLKALEHPGLWNGAMAYWNTLFVEVPGETFTPVKTVEDLLRPEHAA